MNCLSKTSPMRLCWQLQETFRQEYKFFLRIFFLTGSLCSLWPLWNLLCSPGCLWIHRDLSAPASQVLGFLFFFSCVCICMCHMCLCTHRGQKRALDPQGSNSKQEFKNSKYTTPIQRYPNTCWGMAGGRYFMSPFILLYIVPLWAEYFVPVVRALQFLTYKSQICQAGSDSVCWHCMVWPHPQSKVHVFRSKAAVGPLCSMRLPPETSVSLCVRFRMFGWL